MEIQDHLSNCSQFAPPCQLPWNFSHFCPYSFERFCRFFNRYWYKQLTLGILYYIYASMLSIFCMNSINIYAGINGLECGQSLIIGFGVIMINICEILTGKSQEHINNQFLSLYVVIPFITVSLVLIYFNKFPSKVFVGDTYCYFAGTVFASVGILGHFSKTLLLMFLPQIFNFLLSIPQLVGLKPCPRHRLARFSKDTGLLYTTYPENLNLLNFSLHVLGPQTEKDLADKLMILQVACCVLGIVLRYSIGYLVFD